MTCECEHDINVDDAGRETYQWAKREAENVDGHDERGEFFIVVVEFCLDFGDGWSKHGGC